MEEFYGGHGHTVDNLSNIRPYNEDNIEDATEAQLLALVEESEKTALDLTTFLLQFKMTANDKIKFFELRQEYRKKHGEPDSRPLSRMERIQKKMSDLSLDLGRSILDKGDSEIRN